MTHTKDEALKLALDALESVLANHNGAPVMPWIEARDAIKQARALDKKAENARELGLDYEPVGLIDRLTNPEQHYEFTDPKKANAVLMPLCQEAADALAAPVQPVATLFGSLPVYDTTPPAAQPAPVQEPVAQSLKDAVFTVIEGFNIPHDVRKILESAYYTTPPAQPAVPDALNPKDENPAYAAGWNDCRAEMLKGMK